MRVWQERGDYSQLTEDSIRNPVQEDKEEQADEVDRPSVEDMHKLQETMLQNLVCVQSLSAACPHAHLDFLQDRSGRVEHSARLAFGSLCAYRPARCRRQHHPASSANPHSRPDRSSPSSFDRSVDKSSRRPSSRFFP